MSTEAVRVCKQHHVQVIENERTDKMTCPRGHAVTASGFEVQLPAPAPGAPPPRLRGAALVSYRASVCLRTAEGDVPAACARLHADAGSNPDLHEALLDMGIERAIAEIAGMGLSSLPVPAAGPAIERAPAAPGPVRTYRGAAAQARVRGVEGLTLLGKANLRDLMSFAAPAVGIRRLAVATKNEVRTAAQEFGKAARGLGVHGRWLALVAAELPDDGAQVRAYLSEGRLGLLYGQAEHEMEGLAEAVGRGTRTGLPAPAITGGRS